MHVEVGPGRARQLVVGDEPAAFPEVLDDVEGVPDELVGEGGGGLVAGLAVEVGEGEGDEVDVRAPVLVLVSRVCCPAPYGLMRGRGEVGEAAAVYGEVREGVHDALGLAQQPWVAAAPGVEHHRREEAAAGEWRDVVVALGLDVPPSGVYERPGAAHQGHVWGAVGTDPPEAHLHPAAVDLDVLGAAADDAHEGQGFHELDLDGHVRVVVLHHGGGSGCT